MNNTKLNENNIGWKIIVKMGWKRCQGLGSNGQGIVEPVVEYKQIKKNGIGYDEDETYINNLHREADDINYYRETMALIDEMINNERQRQNNETMALIDEMINNER